VIGWLRRLADRVGGKELPEGSTVRLADDEHVLAVGDRLVATSLGLWLPDEDGESYRAGWHLISKATWDNEVLTIIEARETGSAGEAVLLEDLPPRRYSLRAPGRLPELVHERVTDSVKSSHRKELPGGGAWFVQRKVPGRDGISLQVRADPGTDEDAVRTLAANVAAEIARARSQQ
jgi:hypothetical protein